MEMAPVQLVDGMALPLFAQVSILTTYSRTKIVYISGLKRGNAVHIIKLFLLYLTCVFLLLQVSCVPPYKALIMDSSCLPRGPLAYSSS